VIGAAIAAWLLTVAVEVPVVAALFPGQRARLALACALGTSLTNLAMNLVLPRWLGTGALYLLVGELSALVLEALLYAAVSRPRDLVRAATASALANGASFAAGLLVFPPGSW
jgi:hypothetical protein